MLSDNNFVSETLENVQYLLPGAKVIKLRGYSRAHKVYTIAKSPVEKWKVAAGLSGSEIAILIRKGHWIGASIPAGGIVIDIDDSKQGELVKGLLDAQNVHCHCIRTLMGGSLFLRITNMGKRKLNK
ncbi:hypothetical protein [Bacillus subtilis]|uniref:hypothetical protein n=1 Tax=Bacillus subtilis TaxID=1423 RepID=UPI00155FBB69|nr:hypothetical protein [Bacillus subtilis]MEC1424068.1 hypothetical protein [Bacillus subtilis]NRF44787.1 hypothetical protein [Bacillus subtilis]